ncbi:hypothetical protein [Pseudomonas sichuanensis]|uniref:hypothetical protein n=1 Tax=Pseudomonas sichuanensis TaxID=2213015 RepID=UPI003D2E5559
MLGEQQIQTCEGCATSSPPGAGLTPLPQETYETKLTALQELLKSGSPITSEKLREACSDPLLTTCGLAG